MSEAGTYQLQTINNLPRPQWVKTEGCVSTVVLDSQLVITPPHGFAGFFDYQNTDTCIPCVTTPREAWTDGSYAKADGLYNFVFDNPHDTAPESGTIHNGTLILYAGGNRFLYTR